MRGECRVVIRGGETECSIGRAAGLLGATCSWRPPAAADLPPQRLRREPSGRKRRSGVGSAPDSASSACRGTTSSSRAGRPRTEPSMQRTVTDGGGMYHRLRRQPQQHAAADGRSDPHQPGCEGHRPAGAGSDTVGRPGRQAGNGRRHPGHRLRPPHRGSQASCTCRSTTPTSARPRRRRCWRRCRRARRTSQPTTS